MMMLMMVMIVVFICDQREDCFHQVEVVDPGNQHQHFINIVWDFFVFVRVITLPLSVHM